MSVFSNSFSEETWYQKYKAPKDTCVQDTWRRVAKDLAKIEDDPKKWEERFYELMEDFKFMPGGRILSNAGAGFRGTSYINCFVDGASAPDADSLPGIYKALHRQATILKSEGGYGFCADFMRPCGADIQGIGGQSPGAVKFLELWDKSSEIITCGSGKKAKKGQKNFIRKGAQMVTMSICHPDIEEFIEAKRTPGRLTKFNMSVLVTDEFMRAGEADEEWNLIFPNYLAYPRLYKKIWDGNFDEWAEKALDSDESDEPPMQVYQTIKARELWDKIMRSTYEFNDPGIIFQDNMNHYNNLYYEEHLSCCNPCLTYNNKVYVADGRGAVSIGDLAKEGRDVDVFCLDNIGRVVVRRMRHPRVTGYNQPIYKVTIEGGHTLRCTGNHKFFLTDGTTKEAKDLQEGDSLFVVFKDHLTFNEVMPDQKSKKQPYAWLSSSQRKSRKSEHRLIAEHNYGAIPKGHVVHHRDFDPLNNAPENLQVMSREDHIKLHSEHMKGDNNPMRRAHTEWGEEKWAQYRSNMSNSTSGERNGRYSGYSNEELREHALKLCKQLGYKFSNKDWAKYAKKHGLPQQFSKYRVNGIGTVTEMAIWAAEQCGFETKGDPRQHRTMQSLREQGYEVRLDDDHVRVKKTCEYCGDDFWIISELREQAVCSIGCANRLRTHKIKIGDDEAVQNHKVISVERDGFEDVYNGTVDEYHNLLVGGFIETNEYDRQREVYIATGNCGEIPLERHGTCLLGSLNLTKYINSNYTDWNYTALSRDIPDIVRLMDNVNDITPVFLKETRGFLQSRRRIGLGITGFGSALLMMKVKYGNNDRCLSLIQSLMEHIVEEAYKASVALAKEKGAFPLFDKEKFLAGKHIEIVSPEVRRLIAKHGLRNSHLTSIQPTGNTSCLANLISGGLEPVFMFSYVRTSIQPVTPEGLYLPKNVDWVNKKYTSTGDTEWKWIREGRDNLLATKFEGKTWKYDQQRGLLKEEVIEDYGVTNLKTRGEWDENADWAVCINDLSVEDHVKPMGLFAKYVDQGISKTVNCPADISYDEFKDIYTKAWENGIKGITTYRAGTMAAVLASTDRSDKPHVSKTEAPERPRELPCDVYHISVKGEKYFVLVGLFNGDPYEIFAGKNGYINKKVKTGTITKLGRPKGCIQSCTRRRS